MLGIHVGGNNAASAMGPSIGAGTRSRWMAATLIGIFSLSGAVLFGQNVVKTIGNGITEATSLPGNGFAAVVVLLVAASMVAVANKLRAPLATSHAMVGAVVGVGLFFGDVNWERLSEIIAWWIVTPVIALVLSFVIGRYFYDSLRVSQQSSPWLSDDSIVFKAIVFISGCFLAFSAGSNSLAKVVGPLVGAGILPGGGAALLGGLGIAAGAIVVGPKIMETVGKGITRLDPLMALLIEGLSATIILSASAAGIPVSLAEIVTCSVIGFSCAKTGIRFTLKNEHVRVMAKLWPICPLATAFSGLGICAIISALSSVDLEKAYVASTLAGWH